MRAFFLNSRALPVPSLEGGTLRCAGGPSAIPNGPTATVRRAQLARYNTRKPTLAPHSLRSRRFSDVVDSPQPQVAMAADTALAASFIAAIDAAGKAHGLPRPGANKMLIVNDISCGAIAVAVRWTPYRRPRPATPGRISSPVSRACAVVSFRRRTQSAPPPYTTAAQRYSRFPGASPRLLAAMLFRRRTAAGA